jgi:hypothetical protein
MVGDGTEVGVEPRCLNWSTGRERDQVFVVSRLAERSIFGISLGPF